MLRGLRRGLARSRCSPRIADAIANVLQVRARGALAAVTLLDALDVARFQAERGRPLPHRVAEASRPVDRAWRIAHKGWGRARPPFLCFADRGENVVRAFRCWECGASHGESALGEGTIELHVDHAGPWPDLLDGGTIVSARVVDALEGAGVTGFRASPINLHVKGRPDVRPAYRWLEVPVTAAGVGRAGRCKACGAFAARRATRRLVGGGEDLFRSAWDREAIYASPRVRALARARRWTGFRFLPVGG